MTTPPQQGGNGGLNGAAVIAALNATNRTLQALLHQQQTFSNLPSSARGTGGAGGGQPLQNGSPAGGGPAPVVPSVGWFQQAASSFFGVPQQRGGGQGRGAPQPGPTPPQTPQGGNVGGIPGYGYGGLHGGMHGIPMGGTWGIPGAPAVSPTQYSRGSSNGQSGVGQWARSTLPTVGRMVGGTAGGVAGAAVVLGTQIPAEVRSQRDKNAYYQSIEGGSNVAGFGERLGEEGYRWSTFGVLSSSEARDAYKGVTRLGYSGAAGSGVGGASRQDALNFVYHNKTSTGATVDESLQELQVASKSALVNFKDLSAALKDVSDSAGKAGVNAQQARAEYTQLLDTAIKSGYGSSATGAAQLQQDVKNSYGRPFQNVDVSGRLSTSHAVLAASTSHMSVADYMLGGKDVQAKADQALDTASLKNVLKPGVEDWVKAQIKARGGKVDDTTASQIGEEMLRQFYPNDLTALAATIGQLTANANMSPTDAGYWIVSQYNGKGAQAATTASEKKTSKINSVKTGQTTIATPDQEQKGGFLGFGATNSQAYDAYTKWTQSSKGWSQGSSGNLKSDPAVVNVLNAIKGDDSTKVIVHTKDGQRVVSLADAVKNHRDELASGKAIIAEGAQAGKSVAEVAGPNGIDPLRDFSKEAAKTDNSGQSLSDWQSSNSAASGKLQITLSTEARRLLTIMDSTGTNGSAGSSTPPISTWPTNPTSNR